MRFENESGESGSSGEKRRAKKNAVRDTSHREIE
jgi:hypothetical protein